MANEVISPAEIEKYKLTRTAEKAALAAISAVSSELASKVEGSNRLLSALNSLQNRYR